MPFLFDTDAVSELLRPRPLPAYLRWLNTVQREDQYVSAITIGELYSGAYRSHARDRHVQNIEVRVVPAVTVLPYDSAVAKEFGQIRAALKSAGRRLADTDLQIAATARFHGLELITGNVRHFERVPGLIINRVLAVAKAAK